MHMSKTKAQGHAARVGEDGQPPRTQHGGSTEPGARPPSGLVSFAQSPLWA